MRWTLLALLSLSFMLVGCEHPNAPSKVVVMEKPGPRSFLALGDSYTIGEAVGEQERWPVQLVAALRKQHVAIDDPVILARTGWSTGELQAALDAANYTGPYRLVSVLIGVNDQYRKGKPEDYRPVFAKLLKQAVALAGDKAGHVLILSIPDYDYGPVRKFGPQQISETIDQFNAVCKEETQRQGAVYVDVTALSPRAKSPQSLWASDELHFSGAMYAQWVEAMLPRVMEVLK